MDKVKPYLLLLRKHHFWLVAVVVVFVSFYAWYSGTAAYDAQFAQNKGKIDAAFGQADQVRNAANPPNASFAEALKEFQQKQINSTLSAWQTLYDQQKGLLVWFAENDKLSNLKPDEEIPERVRTQYLNYFRNEWNKLFEVIKPLRSVAVKIDESKKPPVASRARNAIGGMGGQPGEQGNSQTRMEGLVEWSQSQRDAIRSRCEWTKPPTTIQVRFAQEDYWVYKALLDIIAETNKSAGATSHSNAAIKRIDELAIAQAAAAPAQADIDLLANQASSSGGEGPSQTIKIPSASSTDEELRTGRYATPAAGDASAAPVDAGGGSGGEFRLIPVVMRFRMDERRIPNLLVACANSPLTVEVRQVVYNPGKGSRSSSGGSPSSGLMGSMGAAPSPASRPAAAARGDARTAAELYDATVELRGVVYIFNPPSKAALGIAEEPPAEAVEMPVGDPPPAAPTDVQPNPPQPGESPMSQTGEPASPPAADAAAPAEPANAQPASSEQHETPQAGEAPPVDSPPQPAVEAPQ